MKKLIGIEALLTWAFTQELIGKAVEKDGPDGIGSSWGAFEMVEKLGCFVDGSGTPWDQLRIEQPHEDAVSVAKAVAALGERSAIEIRRPANPFPDWIDESGTVAAEVDLILQTIEHDKKQASHLVALVITSAVLGRGPDWEANPPLIVPYSHNGKDAAWFIKRKAKDILGKVYEYEDDGFDYRKRRPFKGAYHKYRLDRSIRGAVISRLEWQLWQSALSELHDSLAGRLERHEVQTFSADPHPWAPKYKTAGVYQAFEIAA